MRGLRIPLFIQPIRYCSLCVVLRQIHPNDHVLQQLQKQHKLQGSNRVGDDGIEELTNPLSPINPLSPLHPLNQKDGGTWLEGLFNIFESDNESGWGDD